MAEFILPNSSKLTGTENFDIWYSTIMDYLEAKNLKRYVDVDIINLLNRGDDENPLDQQQLQAVRNQEREDAVVRTIININVSEKIKHYIKNQNTAFAKMDKLKNLYQMDADSQQSMWIKKLYTIHAKSIDDTMKIINEMMELFELLSHTTMNPSNLDKLSLMFDAIPKELQNRVNFSSQQTYEQFYEEIKDKHTIMVFNRERNFLAKTPSRFSNNQDRNVTKNQEDYMDIDNFENHRKNTNYNKKHKSYIKHCVICENDGHIAKDCYFNPVGTNRNNKRVKNFNNKRKCNKSKKSHRNFKNNNSINNTEISRDHDTESQNNEFNEIFGDYIDSIQYEYDDNIDLCVSNIKSDQSKFELQPQHLNTEIVFPTNYEKVFSENSNYILGVDHVSNIKYDDDHVTFWTFDTGASEHITNDKSLLYNYTEERVIMKCANKSTCIFEGFGSFQGTINGFEIILPKVLYSKHVNKNLISGVKLAKEGIISLINNNNQSIQLILKNKNNIIGKFIANNANIIKIPIWSDFELNELSEQSMKLWHNRLGHFYHDDIYKYINLHTEQPNKCTDCQIAKLKRKPHNGTITRATEILEIIHSDIIGPIDPSFINSRYIITFLDEFSRKAWIYLLTSKSEAPSTIIYFFKLITNLTNKNIKIFRTDNGKEYTNKKIINFCNNNGIKKVFSPPYNPQSNGIAERYNQTLIQCAKTLLYSARLSIDFWSFAVIYANYLYNLVPHSGIGNLIPNEIFYNKKVDISKIRVFGCTAFFNNINNKASKFSTNSKKGIFLGISLSKNCYIIMDKENQKLQYVREAVFLENELGNYVYKYDIFSFSNNSNDINSKSFFNILDSNDSKIYNNELESRDNN